MLKSINKNWYYVGLTNNIERRLTQHNLGKVRSTKHNRPYSMVYTKEFDTREEARDYEKFLKIRSNKEKIISTLIT